MAYGKVYLYNTSLNDGTLAINGKPGGTLPMATVAAGKALTFGTLGIDRANSPRVNEPKFATTTTLTVDFNGYYLGPHDVEIKPNKYKIEKDLQIVVFATGWVVLYEGELIQNFEDDKAKAHLHALAAKEK
jgi:hypothetical protein